MGIQAETPIVHHSRHGGGLLTIELTGAATFVAETRRRFPRPVE